MASLVPNVRRRLHRPRRFLELRRTDDQRHLAGVRSDGDWESWNAFFLEGVATMATEKAENARGLLEQVAKDCELLMESPRASLAGLRLFMKLTSHPILFIPLAMKLLGTTLPTAATAVTPLESLGLVRERSGRTRDRTFSYERFLELLGSGRR